MHCTNINHKQIQDWAKEFGKSPEYIGGIVSLWQESNNRLDEFPSKLWMENQLSDNTTDIKPGVEELFDSNPELAHAAYEALGFKQNTEAKKTGLLDYFLNVKKDSIFQELIQIAENLGIGIEEYESDSPLQANWNGKNVTINKTYGKATSNVIAHEVVHGILHTLTNNDYANSKLNLKLEKFKIELFDYIEKKGINNLNLPPELRILKLDYIKKMSNQEIVTYAFTDSQFSEFLASIKTDAKISSRESFWSKLINIFNTTLKELGFTSKLDELIDILNTEVPLFNNTQITPQQKQQATFMFSEFLDVYLQDFEQVEKILKEEKIIDKKCS